MVVFDGFYFAENCTTIWSIIQELKNFDLSYMPTVLAEYIRPIHHLELDDDLKIVYFVVDESESDVFIRSVDELIQVLNYFDEDLIVMVKGDSVFPSSFNFITDYILDVNSCGDEIFIPFNVSFMTVYHCNFTF